MVRDIASLRTQGSIRAVKDIVNEMEKNNLIGLIAASDHDMKEYKRICELWEELRMVVNREDHG